MKTPNQIQQSRALLLLAVASFSGLAWFSQAQAGEPPQPEKQRTYATAEDASKALIDAAKDRDREAMRGIFGPEVSELVTGDEVLDAALFERFCKSVEELCLLSHKSGTQFTLNIGVAKWPFPIPITKKDGQWFFDTEAGKEEIVNRHIGEDELSAIEICRRYVEAQREYSEQDRDGSDVLQFAQKIWSTEGKKDGLYWKSEKHGVSPLDPIIRQALAQGYDHHGEPGDKFACQGYIFRILAHQGPDAPGGKYDYVINGHMIGGFALIAYPDTWGKSGIMTFIVNQRGKVYQRDLGSETERLAGEIKEYNPGREWKLVKEATPAGE
jgi:hypothetical protein